MGDALNVMQVATGGAAVLVAEMAKSSWETVRAAMARLFRRGGEETAEQELRLLDAAHDRLVGSPDSERAGITQTLEQELMIQLAAFLQKNPDAAAELKSLVDRSDEADEVWGRVSVHHNTGSQVVIAGGSATAGDFSYGMPEGKK
ncbi:hypothetical protein OOK44_17490 [Streptomyces cellulosae]|uniref:hypothetical protein n=1 Tax=Streptomyces TaxID=1883 RepID=UPI0010C0E7CF|nr:hypothetical protein [Streptomyces cellulosae]WTB82817.1 hypothetical protein OG837_16850 [Streptomyces cellulosae]WTC57015.1 hypothetical protein OH715_17795 [Streptomyces cellulosae]